MEKETKDFSLRGYFVRYPLLINKCIVDFFNDFQDQFQKSETGKYVLKKKISDKILKQLFFDYISKNIVKLQEKIPKNGLLIIADSGIERRNSFKMVEDDIDISLDKIEKIIVSIFNKFFSKKYQLHNVVFCKHRELISNDWEKILKIKVFGRKNFQNLEAEFSSVKKCIEEENSGFSFTSGETKLIVDECVGYILEALKNVNHFSSYR